MENAGRKVLFATGIFIGKLVELYFKEVTKSV